MEIFVGLILFDYPLRTLARARVGHVRRQIRIKPCGLDQSRRGPSSVDPSLRVGTGTGSLSETLAGATNGPMDHQISVVLNCSH